MGKDQSLEYLKKKIEGLSPRTVEGKCLVVASLCQAPLALLKFYNGLLCSFEAKVTLFRLPEAGNCSVEFLTRCLADGEVKEEGKSLEGMKAWSLHFRQRLDPGFSHLKGCQISKGAVPEELKADIREAL